MPSECHYKRFYSRPTQDNPSYESHYLLRPLCLDPEGDPSCAEKQSAEIEHTSRWLLLDRTRFTLSGIDSRGRVCH